MTIRHKDCALGGWTASVLCLLALSAAVPAAVGDVAFEYDPVPGEILSASFSADFASLVGHRWFGTTELNWLRLVDGSTGLPQLDLSDDLFGTAVWPDPPQVDMGPLETGWVTADIDASFFPALAGGRVGLIATFTDTDDAMFAIDFLSLTIETSAGTVQSYYGWPVGNENDGFGLGLADGADLPSELPDALPAGSTGTGFDETISSKSISALPEPASLGLLILASLALLRRWS